MPDTRASVDGTRVLADLRRYDRVIRSRASAKGAANRLSQFAATSLLKNRTFGKAKKFSFSGVLNVFAFLILLGISSAPANFVPMKLVREGINLLTSMIYDHPSDFEHVIDHVAKGFLQPSKVVTHTYRLEGIQEALKLAGTGAAGKIHINLG